MGCSHTLYGDIEGWMFDADLLHLRKRCAETASMHERILEIGSFCGLSTAILTEKGGRVVCVDPFIGGEDLPNRDSYPAFEKNMRSIDRLENIEVLRMRSDEAFKQIHEKFRVIFVDGSHEYDTVFGDIASAWKCTETDGWIVIDDVMWGDSKPVLAALLSSGLPFAHIKGTKMAEIHKEAT